MAGRNIFSQAPDVPSPSNASVDMTTPKVSAVAAAESSGNGSHHQDHFQISWLGTFDPAYTGIWIDSALLLVFGGIPWQVRYS